MPEFEVRQLIIYHVDAPDIKAAALKAEKNLHTAGNFDYRRNILWNDTDLNVLDENNNEHPTRDLVDIDFLDRWKANRRTG